MIEKNRLEELIEQKATIWVQNKYCGAYDVELNHLYHIEITDNKESLLYWDESIDEGTTKEEVLVDYLEYLYETEEDAEFASEFQNIKRVETLNLPFWEDIQYTKNYFIYNFTINNNYNFFGRMIILKDYNIRIVGSTQGVLHEEYFDENYSKENYIKACKIVIKLFLGEKNE